MATDYSINYDDERFTKVESEKDAALSELEKTYAGMIQDSDKYYQAQIDASKQWADKQSQLQQEQTDFAIKEIEQQKAQAKKDYLKEQSGAYVDWQKQSNEYGSEAEKMAAMGLQNTGYSESSQVSMYNTYQNRISTAREAFVLAKQNYDNAITEARLQNNSILAEIAYEALQQQLELSLQGFQYKNTLLLQKADQKITVENNYYNRYQDVLDQINKENALAEEVRQYNASLAEEQRQHNEAMALEREQFEWQKAQAVKKSSSGGGSKSSSKKSSSSSNASVKKGSSTASAAVAGGLAGTNVNKLTYTDVAYTAAQMRKAGATKQEINTYLNQVVGGSGYKATTSVSQDLKELKSSYVGTGGR